MDSDLGMFHHITQIGGAERVKEPNSVTLNVFGPIPTIVRFKDPNFFFGCIFERKVTYLTDFESFTKAKEFVRLKESDKD